MSSIAVFVLRVSFSASLSAYCIDHSDFHASAVQNDLRQKITNDTAAQQAKELYRYLSEKYCWLH